MCNNLYQFDRSYRSSKLLVLLHHPHFLRQPQYARLRIGYLDGEAVDDGERRLLPVGVRLQELGEELVVLVAQVGVQRGRPLLGPAASNIQRNTRLICCYTTSIYV
jgi:hypothetical protein